VYNKESSENHERDQEWEGVTGSATCIERYGGDTINTDDEIIIARWFGEAVNRTQVPARICRRHDDKRKAHRMTIVG